MWYSETMKIYLGADHGGFAAKEAIKKRLTEWGYDFIDLGNEELDPSDDYPDYGVAVAKKVSENPEEHRGILFCRSGIGMNIVANKIKGVRAAEVFDEKMAEASRGHDDTNVLSIAADYLSQDRIGSIVKTWLETPFSGEERHIRRLNKIRELAKNT